MAGSKRRRAWVAMAVGLFCATLTQAETLFDYQLKPIQVAEGTWVISGVPEDFSRSNGGNIVNIGFIETSEGVVLIDTGPSLRYAQQLEAAIARVTPQPIVAAIITHHHPDHWFGNQHFKTLPIYVLPETLTAMVNEGDNFADNLYRMSGDWMRSTEPTPANQTLTDNTLSIGDHSFRLIKLKGHTIADLAVLDTSTGVLFTGDLAFNQRAPTTPHADIDTWLAALDSLGDIDYRLLVPGHGQPAHDDRAIQFTRHYLLWLQNLLRQSAQAGDVPTDVINKPIPAAFQEASLVREELSRSVVHLYPGLEANSLSTHKQGGYN